MEAQETIQRMQEELKNIKQERKRAELDNMGSFKARTRVRGNTKESLKRGQSKKKVFGKQVDVPDQPSMVPGAKGPSGRGQRLSLADAQQSQV